MNDFALVEQEDEWGCGVACVASRLGVTYAVAKSRLEKQKGSGIEEKPKGLDLDPIVKVLHRAGVDVVADWFAKEMPAGTIAYIDGAAPYKDGHYLLKVAGGWMDPWSSMPAKAREAKVQKGLPKGTNIKVALVPK